MMNGLTTTARTDCRFTARPEFRNPAGFVQGGFLAAMLDDTMGPAVLMKSGGRVYTATIDLRVSYIAPAKIGSFVGEARVVQILLGHVNIATTAIYLHLTEPTRASLKAALDKLMIDL